MAKTSTSKSKATTPARKAAAKRVPERAAPPKSSPPAKAPRSAEASTFDALQALHLALTHFDHAAARELSLSRSGAACLRLLVGGGRRATEIGQALGLTSGSVTALVDRLEAGKLVKRTVSEADRRAVHIELTPATARRLAKAYEPLESAFESALGAKKKVALDALLTMARSLSA